MDTSVTTKVNPLYSSAVCKYVTTSFKDPTENISENKGSSSGWKILSVGGFLQGLGITA